MKKIQVTPQLSFSEAINAATSKVFQFTGRSRRSEYWWTMLLVFILNVVIPIIGLLLSLATIPLTFRRLHDTGRSGWWLGGYILMNACIIIYLIYFVLIVLMASTNGTELNADYSNFRIFLPIFLFILVSLIYQIVLFVLCCLDSEVDENQYGESPKYKIVEEDEEEPIS